MQRKQLVQTKLEKLSHLLLSLGRVINNQQVATHEQVIELHTNLKKTLEEATRLVELEK